MAVSTKVWAVSEVVTASDKNTFEQNNLTDLQTQVSASSFIEPGEYTGDGAISKVISLTDTSLVVKFVKIVLRQTSDGGAIAEYWTSPEIMDDHASGGAILTGGNVFQANRIIALGTGSFTVDDAGSNSHPNSSGAVYNFVAMGTH